MKIAKEVADVLKKVAVKIKNNPQKFKQSEWCGSACCIYGHVWLEMKGRKRHDGIFTAQIDSDVSEFLNLDETDYRLSSAGGGHWPTEFKLRYRRVKERSDRNPTSKYLRQLVANVGHDRILHYIKTGE